MPPLFCSLVVFYTIRKTRKQFSVWLQNPMVEVGTLTFTLRNPFALVKVFLQSPSLQPPGFTPMLPSAVFSTTRRTIALFLAARSSTSFSLRFGDWTRIVPPNARSLLVLAPARFLSWATRKSESSLMNVLLIWRQMLPLANTFRGSKSTTFGRSDLTSVRRTLIEWVELHVRYYGIWCLPNQQPFFRCLWSVRGLEKVLWCPRF